MNTVLNTKAAHNITKYTSAHLKMLVGSFFVGGFCAKGAQTFCKYFPPIKYL